MPGRLPQRWFEFAAIPYSRMPDDDILWYPAALAGRHLKGFFGCAGLPLCCCCVLLLLPAAAAAGFCCCIPLRAAGWLLQLAAVG